MQKFFITRLVLAVGLLLAAALFFLPANAQTPASHLSELVISLWPEYDQPNVLVIYKMTLAPDVSLPASVTVRVPASSGSPNAVAARQVDNLVNVAYNEQVQGDWNLISFTATVPEMWVEYYDSELTKDGDSRHYKYSWPGDFNVDSLVVEVQQPVDSSNFVTSPSLGGTEVRSDGLTYHFAQVGSSPQGEIFEITVDYDKSSDVLSAEGIQVQPSEPLSNETPGRFTSSLPLPENFAWLVVLGIVGVALIVGGGLWYWRSSHKDNEPMQRRRHAPSSVKATVQANNESIYCPQCGKRASGGDKFCRQCGSRLRTD